MAIIIYKKWTIVTVTYFTIYRIETTSENVQIRVRLLKKYFRNSNDSTRLINFKRPGDGVLLRFSISSVILSENRPTGT